MKTLQRAFEVKAVIFHCHGMCTLSGGGIGAVDFFFLPETTVVAAIKMLDVALRGKCLF